MIENIILGMVLHKPLTGYDIKKEVETSVGNFVKISHGSLYPALKKLSENNLLVMREEPQNGRMKKYYHSTDLGREEFLEWLESPLDPNSLMPSLLAKVYFFRELPNSSKREKLNGFEAHFEEILRKLESIEKQVLNNNENDIDYYEMATLYYGIQNIQGVISWIRNVKEQKQLSELISNNTQGGKCHE